MTTTAISASPEVLLYNALGLPMVFWEPNGKKGPDGPEAVGWTERRNTLADYHPGLMVGLFTGAQLADGTFLVDIDFDWADGLPFAKDRFPGTPLMFGRPGKIVSHAFYRVSKRPAYRKFERVDKKQGNYVEFRGAKEDGTVGYQTMVPPSVHPDFPEAGPLALRDPGLLKTLDDIPLADDIARTTVLFAIKCALLDVFPPGSFKHDARLAAAGFFRRCRLSDEEATSIVEDVAKVTGNSFGKAKGEVRSTYGKSEKEAYTGGPQLAEAIGQHGEQFVKRVREWLGVPDPDAYDHQVQKELLTLRARQEARRLYDQEVRERAEATPAVLRALTLPQLAGQVFPDRRVLLARNGAAIFREGHIGQVYAQRGHGKTWIGETLALVAATSATALGFSAPSPSRVLYVDGEMAGEEIQERFALLCERLNVPGSENLVVVAQDWQESFLPRLDLPEGQAALEPFVEHAQFIILDNRSCLFDPEGEKDPSAWQPAQDYVLSLRRRGKAVLLIHHANRQGGARGHSKSEDVMNLLIRLSRPEDYSAEQGARFRVDFDKSRGVWGAAVRPFIAHLREEGWVTEPVERDDETPLAEKKLRDYLCAANKAGARPTTKTAACKAAGGNRNQVMAAWDRLVEAGAVIGSEKVGFYLAEDEAGRLL